MGRKKTVTKVTNTKPPVIENSFAEAIGYSSPFGQMAGMGGPQMGAQMEQSDALFNTLRWYLVSNFRQLLSQAFVEIGLVQTICCVPVDDALRGGVMLKSQQIDEEQIKQLQISLDRDGDLDTVKWSAVWERLYGGAGILMLVSDQDPEEAFDIELVNKDTEIEFRDVDMWELFWDKQNVEGYDAQLQEHEFEFYRYYSSDVHKSRVMKLKGLKAPSFIRPRLRGWGLSVVETLIRSINQYIKATDLGYEVLDEFKLDVYKIKNLVNSLNSPNGTNAVKQRVAMANWQKNYQNAIVMDSEDDFDHKQLSFSGLAEAMEGIRMQVASDMRMPISKLFGQGVVGGLGQSDGNDIENYNSMIESEIRGKLKYHILRMCEIKCQKLFGFVPNDLELEFKPLRELSALDQETVKTAKFTRLTQALAAGAISDQDFKAACNKGNLFDVHIDEEEPIISPQEDETDSATDENKDQEESGANREYSRKLAVTKNSEQFDRASYEADGQWESPQRIKGLLKLDHILKNPKFIEAKKEAGNDDSFALWLFKKRGGTL